MKKNCFRFLLVALVALTTVPMYGQRPILKAKTPNLQLRGLQIIAHAVGRNHWVNPSPPVPNPGPQPPIITSVSPNVPTIPKIKMPDLKPPPRLSAAERQKVEDFRNREQLYRQGLQQLKKGNLKSARSLFKRSADNGQYVPAKYEYGKMLIADGDTASIKMGIQQLFSAAVMGNEDAMFDLGWAYTQWPSFSPKPSINLFWLCRSGEKGNPLGHAYAGNILNEKNDTAKALLLWERAYANRKKTYRGSMPKEEARQLMSLAMYNLGSHITLAKHIYAEAVSYLDYAHTLGNVDAGAMLGWIYATDNTGVKDVQKALPLLEEGAKQNNEIACWALAELYMNGEDVPRDSVKALQYYKVAADSGDVYSTERVVSCYYEANDYDNALSYATRDYMAQHLQTIFVAGQCLYFTNRGMEAVPYMKKALAGGMGEATGYLYRIYEKADQRDSALVYLRESIKEGSSEGMRILAKHYLDGDWMKKDVQEAISLYHQAAHLEDGLACRSLVDIYTAKKKVYGLKPDYEQAQFYLHEGMRLNDPVCYRLFAQWTWAGKHGVKKDKALARTLMEEAAELGDEIAKAWLTTYEK